MPSRDITFCEYFDCKFYNSCRRYSYIYSDEELGIVSISNFRPRNPESDDPNEYCEFYMRRNNNI